MGRAQVVIRHGEREAAVSGGANGHTPLSGRNTSRTAFVEELLWLRWQWLLCLQDSISQYFLVLVLWQNTAGSKCREGGRNSFCTSVSIRHVEEEHDVGFLMYWWVKEAQSQQLSSLSQRLHSLPRIRDYWRQHVHASLQETFHNHTTLHLWGSLSQKPFVIKNC